MAGGATATAAAMCGAGGLQASSRTPVFVELFTSQGCSSCPPADKFMGELTKRPGVVGVTFNVDYWDYLGWRDTLGSPAHSRRQREYAARRGDGRVYTPQMVINGRTHEVGSHRRAVLAEIERQSAMPDRYFVPIELSADGSELAVDVGGGPTDRIIQASTLWVLSITPEVAVKIRRGENAGREIRYYNVVRQMTPVGMWKGDAITQRLPKSQFLTGGNTMCAAVLQVDGGGPILGCGLMRASA
jgi:hypothetical protein